MPSVKMRGKIALMERYGSRTAMMEAVGLRE
jgi:hypothetical protein